MSYVRVTPVSGIVGQAESATLVLLLVYDVDTVIPVLLWAVDAVTLELCPAVPEGEIPVPGREIPVPEG